MIFGHAFPREVILRQATPRAQVTERPGLLFSVPIIIMHPGLAMSASTERAHFLISQEARYVGFWHGAAKHSGCSSLLERHRHAHGIVCIGCSVFVPLLNFNFPRVLVGGVERSDEEGVGRVPDEVALAYVHARFREEMGGD